MICFAKIPRQAAGYWFSSFQDHLPPAVFLPILKTASNIQGWDSMENASRGHDPTWFLGVPPLHTTSGLIKSHPELSEFPSLLFKTHGCSMVASSMQHATVFSLSVVDDPNGFLVRLWWSSKQQHWFPRCVSIWLAIPPGTSPWRLRTLLEVEDEIGK